MRIAGTACESARAALHTTHDHDEKRRWRGGYVVEQRRARGAEAEAEREEEEEEEDVDDDDDDDDDEKQRRSSSNSSSSKCFSPVMGSQWVGGQYWVVGGGWWCACNNGRTDEQHSTSRHDRRQCGKNYLPSPTLCDRHESYLLLLPPTYLYTASRFRSTLLASTSSALSTVPDYLHYLLPTSYSVCQHPACLTSRIPRRRHGVTELQTLQLYSTVCIPSLTCTTPRRGRGSWRAAFSAPQLVLT